MPAPIFQPSALVLVYSTAPNAEVAATLAQKIVEARLAACVNVLPAMHATYVWDGKIETAAEVAMLIKTTGEKSQQLKAFIDAEHPYDTPCFLAFEARDSLPAFAQWLTSSTIP